MRPPKLDSSEEEVTKLVCSVLDSTKSESSVVEPKDFGISVVIEPSKSGVLVS